MRLTKQGQTGAPVDPIARQRVQEHMALHFQYLKQTDPGVAKQLARKIALAEKTPGSGLGTPGAGQLPAAGARPAGISEEGKKKIEDGGWAN